MTVNSALLVVGFYTALAAGCGDANAPNTAEPSTSPTEAPAVVASAQPVSADDPATRALANARAAMEENRSGSPEKIATLQAAITRAEAAGAAGWATEALAGAKASLDAAKGTRGTERAAHLTEAARWSRSLKKPEHAATGAHRSLAAREAQLKRDRAAATRRTRIEALGLPEKAGLLSADRVTQALSRGGMLIDIRPRGDFEGAHFKGAVSWTPEQLRTEGPDSGTAVILYGADSRDLRVAIAARRLLERGFSSVRVVDGGYRALSAEAMRERANTESMADPKAIELGAIADLDALIIDVRDAESFAAGTMPGARSLPWGRLVKEAQTLATDRPVLVVAADGPASLRAARFIARFGRDDIRFLKGGFQSYAANR